MTEVHLVAADALSAVDLHAATVAAFADYLAGPFHMTLEQFPSFIARQGIDLALSRVVLHDGVVCAFAFACPRPEVGRWRLAILGALPAARGRGAAPALLDDFIGRAAAAGLPRVELECFAENERALRLYRSRGFEVVSALDGWTAPEAAPRAPVPASAPAPASTPAGDVQAIDRAPALAWLEQAGRRLAWLPFQMSDRCMAAQLRPLTFWRSGSAQVAFSVVEGTPTQIHGLIDLDPGLRDAETLAQALLAAHPDSFAPPILPGALGGAALGRAGYLGDGMSQVLMTRAV